MTPATTYHRSYPSHGVHYVDPAAETRTDLVVIRETQDRLARSLEQRKRWAESNDLRRAR
jgi:hypothetical protein